MSCRSSLLLILALAACHSSEPPPTTSGATVPSSAALASQVHPTPFTADQIREATKSGRTYRYRVEKAGAPAREDVITLSKTDATGADVTSGGETARVTWEELRKHAEFPSKDVTTREEKVTVPAGEFDCVVYVVRKDETTSTFYFAKKLPGAPILFFTEKGGTRVTANTLLEHENH